MIPQLEDLHRLSEDKQGVAYALHLNQEELRQWAQEIPHEELLAACQPSISTREVLAALHLLTHAPEPPEALRASLEQRLESLASDTRDYTWVWGERSYQKRRFPVAQWAIEARLHLLAHDSRRWRAQRSVAQLRAQEPPPRPEIAPVLRRCAQNALLAGPCAEDALRVAVRGTRRFLALGHSPGELAQALAQALTQAALSRDQVAEVRLLALRELQRAAPWGESLRQGQDLALRGLVEELEDDMVDVRLRRLVRPVLLEIAPEQLDHLQELGALPSAALPQAQELVNRWGRVEEPRAQALASDLRWREVLAALRVEEDLDRSMAAAAVAPYLAGRAPWEALAHRLCQLIPLSGRWHHPGLPSRNQWVDQGHFAAQRLLKLLGTRLRLGEEAALRWLHLGMELLLARDLPGGRDLPALMQRFLDATRHTPPEALERWRGELCKAGADPAQSPAARAAALLLARDQDALGCALQIITDPGEPMTLRSLLGLHLYRWDAAAVEGLALTDLSPWQPRSHSEDQLPICEPSQEVPLAWLVLSAAGHPQAQAQAVRHLGARVSRGARLEEHLAHQRQLTEALTPEAHQAMRRMIASPYPDAPRWSAAICLALLGDPEDEDALVDYMRLHGPWTRLDPTSDDLQALRTVEHLLLRPLQYHEPHHMLEPFLVAGLGQERTDRLMARAFAAMGADALAQGQAAYARHACLRAQHLDPMNLAARRVSKALGL